MTSAATGSVQLAAFTRRQTELNRFLWTTELAYGIVKQDKLLKSAELQNAPAWQVLRHVRSEAWTPTAASRRAGAPAGKYDGTIREMRRQIDTNISTVLWSVSAMFIAEFETYVESRFAGWFAEESAKKRGPFMIPAPAQLLEDLRKRFPEVTVKIKARVVLRADLMKKIRNLYVHKGLAGIPREVDHPELRAWIAQVSRVGPYTAPEASDVVAKVIGGAIDNTRESARGDKRLGEEFFYALFTLTNIRNFVLALDAGFPANPRSA